MINDEHKRHVTVMACVSYESRRYVAR